jgi:ankyrin repeat protein
MAVTVTDSGLLSAAMSGNVGEVRKLLKLELSDTCVNSLGHNLVHVAALNGHIEMVLCLIKEFGCDLNEREWKGRSLLHSACESGVTSLVRIMILEHKADVNAVDDSQVLPIHVAAWKGHTDVVLRLIEEFGCDPSRTGGIGRSLLHHACQGGDVSLVKTLIGKYGADMAAVDIYGDLPIHLAAGKGHTDVVLCLIEDFNCDYNAKGHKNSTLLHRACHGGNVSLVQTLIHDYKANVNAIDDEKEAPIHVAAWRGHTDIVLSLITEFGCDPNTKGRIERSLLHEACQSGNIALVRTLVIEHGAKVDVKDAKKRSPLYIAVASDHFEIALTLIKDFGCDSNVIDVDGSINRAQSMVELLSHEMNYTTSTAADVCTHEDLFFINKIWDDDGIARAKFGQFLLHNACKCNNAMVVKALITQTLSPLLLRDGDGNTALHISSHLNHTDCVRILLDANSPILMKNNRGLTPIDLATGEAKQLLQQYLIEHPGCGKLQKRYDLYLDHVKQKFSGKYSITRVFVLGNAEAGKSSLIESMKRSFVNSPERVSESSVPPHTAGIIPSDYRDQRFGMLHFYDLAGDREYYSSHAAILERVSSLTFGHDFFIVAVDLTKGDDEIKNTLHYWVSFIQHQKFPGNRLSLVVIGSHVDLVDGLKVARKRRLFEGLCKGFKSDLGTQQVAYFTLDCCDPTAYQFDAFRGHILSFKMLSPAYPLFLDLSLLVGVLEKDFGDVTACPMQEIQAHIKATGICLPFETKNLLPIIYALHVAGYLLILNIRRNPGDFYIVLKCSVLTNELFQSLFSEDTSRKVETYNIGMIPDSIIKDILPDGITEECLVHLQFCQRISQKDVSAFPSLSKSVSPGQDYLFFPALCEAAKDVKLLKGLAYSNGWLALCFKSYDYFPPRFLHILKLVFGFTLSIPSGCFPDAEDEQSDFQRRCIMWKTGVYWMMKEGVECLVELVNDSKGIVVISRSEEKYRDNCDAVLNRVVDCVMEVKTKFCHSIKPSFFLLDSVYEGDYLKKHHQFAMRDVERALQCPDENKIINVIGTNWMDRKRVFSMRKCSHWHRLFPIDTKSVLQYLDEVLDNLFQIGLQLGLLESTIRDIEEKFRGDIRRTRQELIDEWINSSIEPPCWWHLVQALKEDYYVLSEDIKRIHGE